MSAEDSTVGAVRALLVHGERLARAEADLALSRARDLALAGGRSAAGVVAGAVCLLIALVFILGAVFFALAQEMAPWRAALLVAAVSALIGSFCLTISLRRKSSTVFGTETKSLIGVSGT